MSVVASQVAQVASGEHSRRLGLSVIDGVDGRGDVIMPFGETITNRGGRVHGGAIASAMVAAARVAALRSERTGHLRRAHLLQVSLSFLAPPRTGSGVKATAVVLRRGRDVAHVEADAYDADENLVSRAYFAFSFLGARPEAAAAAGKVVDELSADEERAPRISASPYLLAADARVPFSPPGVALVWMPVRPNRAAEDPTRIDDGALIALADSCVAYAAQCHGETTHRVSGVTVALSLLLHGAADELVEAKGRAEPSPGPCHSATVSLRTKRSRKLIGTGLGVFHSPRASE
jgi:uncharacterized protein (TIGR00369 family)